MTAAAAPNPYEMLVAEHIGLAWARQDKLADLIGEGAWSVDLQTGRLQFDGGRAFDVSLLGSFGAKAGTWLWAWANDSMGTLPDRVLGPARDLKAFGEAEGFAQFTQEEIPADDKDCHMLALMAVGHLGKGAYYRGAYEGGAAFLLLEPVPELIGPVDIVAIPRLITGFVETGVPARPAITAFLRAEGFEVSEEDGTLFARRGAASLMVSFDEDGRLAEIDGHLPGTDTAAPAPAVRPLRADPEPDQLPVVYGQKADTASPLRALVSWVLSAFGRK